MQALQRAVAAEKNRFLFEMATGTGKTLVSAAVIRLFLRTGDPRRRVLFLVDRVELERRLLLDSYKTFGCETGEPTFRYSLLDGVKENFLVNPIVIDARTEITTQLLSDKGYAVIALNEDGEEAEEIFGYEEYEKKFFSDNTNRAFCKVFLENALRDPISREIGKTIVFCVSQNHAAKITQILNEYAHAMFPGKYQSDFAIQVTSRIADAQQFTVNFANNKLLGSGNFDPAYITSKARVCVTVGMMTTGYDCPDILNLCLMRPIFSPTDFIQIKGRGTRKHDFSEQMIDPKKKEQLDTVQKSRFKLFDFFANCEYFEEKFNYDEKLEVPKPGQAEWAGDSPLPSNWSDVYNSTIDDRLSTLNQKEIGSEGMKVDWMFFEKFGHTIRNDYPVVKELYEAEKWDELLDYIDKNVLNKPAEFFTLEKLRRAINADWRIGMKEIIEKIYSNDYTFKTREERLDEEFDKFDSRYIHNEADFDSAKMFFKTYIDDREFRDIVDSGRFAELNNNPNGEVFRALTQERRKIIIEYIKDLVPWNDFVR
ncbi:hypothetical protein AGMMS49942_18740 [Spirochaetia bacterium]|nr:hypothetical protein AGMMS49942_18740 [Spirochaetia bacterium]